MAVAKGAVLGPPLKDSVWRHLHGHLYGHLHKRSRCYGGWYHQIRGPPRPTVTLRLHVGFANREA